MSKEEQYLQLLTKLHRDSRRSELQPLRFVEQQLEARFRTEKWLPTYPIVVGLKITARCNLRCHHCWAAPDGSHHDIDTLRHILGQLHEVGVLHVNLSGGEPLLHPRFFEILAFIKELGLAIGLYTNGTLLRSDTVRRLRELFHPETDFLHVSFDGVSEQSLTALRREVDFSALLKQLTVATRERLTVRLHTTVSHSNVAELEEIYRAARELRVHTLSVSPLIRIGRGQNIRTTFSATDYVHALLQIRGLQRSPTDPHVRAFVPGGVIVRAAIAMYGPLAWPSSNAALHDRLIRHNMEVMLVGAIGKAFQVTLTPYSSPSDDLGSLRSDPFAAVWRGSHRFRLQLFKRDLTQTPCNGCPYYAFCRGGDWVFAQNQLGTVNARSPDCAFFTGGRDERVALSYE